MQELPTCREPVFPQRIILSPRGFMSFYIGIMALASRTFPR